MIEGIAPDVDKGGFKYVPGVFFNFCNRAKEEKCADKIFLFIIDEINRANITAVFGEVMNLIENKGQRTVLTAKTHTPFTIPPNVVIIGTMNTADKTLAKIDYALRRRFRFLATYPSEKTLTMMVAKNGFEEDVPITVDQYVRCFEVLNAKISKHPLLGKELTLGHVLWTKRDERPYSKHDIGSIFREIIFPQIENYCGANRETLGSLLGADLRDKILFGFEVTDDNVFAFLSVLMNSKVVEENDSKS